MHHAGVRRILTHRLVGHSDVARGPAAEATGEVIGLLHGRLGRVVGQRRRDVGGSRGQSVHAARAVETVCTSGWGVRGGDDK